MLIFFWAQGGTVLWRGWAQAGGGLYAAVRAYVAANTEAQVDQLFIAGAAL